MSKVKKVDGFPDHSGDKKITKKDILMGKGVIPKPKLSKGGLFKTRGTGAATKGLNFKKTI